VLAGGPPGGRHYLVDSNLDWGQDVKNLKKYMDDRHIPEVCLFLLWMAAGRILRNRPLPSVPESEYAGGLDCVAAISVTNLATRRSFGGLDQIEPDARIGYSIYVYDLRRNTAM